VYVNHTLNQRRCSLEGIPNQSIMKNLRGTGVSLVARREKASITDFGLVADTSRKLTRNRNRKFTYNLIFFIL